MDVDRLQEQTGTLEEHEANRAAHRDRLQRGLIHDPRKAIAAIVTPRVHTLT